LARAPLPVIIDVAFGSHPDNKGCRPASSAAPQIADIAATQHKRSKIMPLICKGFFCAKMTREMKLRVSHGFTGRKNKRKARAGIHCHW
jgi:hypothetical protein